MHFALREWKHLKGFLLEGGAVGAVWLLSVVIGPFGTFGELTTPERLQYWAMIIVLNWLQIRLVHHFLHRLFGGQRFWMPVLGSCVLASVPATFEVIWLETTFRPEYGDRIDFLYLFPQVLLLTLAITVPLMHFFTGRGEADAPVDARAPDNGRAPEGDAPPPHGTPAASEYGVEAPPEVPRFLERIPTRLGTDLLCLQAEDHYVRVHTALGDDLILHRFSDAVQELDGLDGLRVHRSWWIASVAVVDVVRRDRKVWLCLRNGLEVPVSRTYLPTVKEAGWS